LGGDPAYAGLGMAMGRRSKISILVVENNAPACELVCDSLNALGYIAKGVTTAEEALKLLHSEPFDILLTDIELPDMSGLPLARVAISFNPLTRIIFASKSGYLVADRETFDFDLVRKPYRVRDITQILKRHASFDSDERKSA